jgi:hypothetical protein
VNILAMLSGINVVALNTLIREYDDGRKSP